MFQGLYFVKSSQRAFFILYKMKDLKIVCCDTLEKKPEYFISFINFILFCVCLFVCFAFVKISKKSLFSLVPTMFVFLFSVMFKHDVEQIHIVWVGRILTISESYCFLCIYLILCNFYESE